MTISGAEDGSKYLLRVALSYEDSYLGIQKFDLLYEAMTELAFTLAETPAYADIVDTRKSAIIIVYEPHGIRVPECLVPLDYPMVEVS